MPLKTFNDLLKLTDLINDKKLRQQVVAVLKKPEYDIYPNEPVSIEDCPGGSWHHTYRGGLIDHLFAVTTISLEISQSLSKIYGEKINQDYLISACLLHDIMKVYDFAYLDGKKDKVIIIDNTIRHAEFGGQFLSQKKFPKAICKMVEQHIPWKGEDVLDNTIELQILLAADKLDSHILFSRVLLFDDYIVSSTDF